MMASKPAKRKSLKFRNRFHLILLRAGFSIFGRIFVKAATTKALVIWFSTHRYPVSKREARMMEKFERKTVQVNDKTVVYYQLGVGKRVLLLHGWNGRAGQFLKMAEALVAAGFQVIMPDAPGHGASDGKDSSIFQFNDTLFEIEKQEGQFDILLGHSFGTMALLYAVNHNVQAGRMVCIAAPSEFSLLLYVFAHGLWLPKPVQQGMHDYLIQRFGDVAMASVEPILNARNYQGQALVIHDEDDRIVPVSAHEALLAAFPNVESFISKKQGHNRVLKSKPVIDVVVEFLTKPKPGSESHKPGSESRQAQANHHTER